MAFIRAAGELFSMHGIDKVTTKQIGSAAGVDASMIRYHFGSKDGLINAVVEYAVKPWSRNNLEHYYEKNKNLLETRDGQVVFVLGMFDVVSHIFEPGTFEPWSRSFILQLLQRPHRLRQTILDKYFKPGIRVFYDVYRTITGNDDFESAFCWYLIMTGPMYLCSGAGNLVPSLHPKGEISNEFDKRLKIFLSRQILKGFNLL